MKIQKDKTVQLYEENFAVLTVLSHQDHGLHSDQLG